MAKRQYLLSYDAMPLLRPLEKFNRSSCCCGLVPLAATRVWKLEETWVFRLDDERYRIDKGFEFNGTSVPAILQCWRSPTGTSFLAGLIHDWLYYHASLSRIVGDDIDQVVEVPFDKWESDQVFRLNASNVLWLGLFFGGYPAWRLSRMESKQRADEMRQIEGKVGDNELEKKPIEPQNHQMVVGVGG